MAKVGLAVVALLLFSGRCGPGFTERPAPAVVTPLPEEQALFAAEGDGFLARWTPDPAAQASSYQSIRLALQVEALGPDHFVSVQVTDCEGRELAAPMDVGAGRSVDDTERVFALDAGGWERLEAVCTTVFPLEGEERILVGGGLVVSTFGAPWLVEVEPLPADDGADEDTDEG